MSTEEATAGVAAVSDEWQGVDVGSAERANSIDNWFALGLTSHMRELHQTDKLTDMSVECGSEVFRLHKAILSFSSGFFRDLLDEAPLTDSHKLDFEPAIEPTTFKLLSESFYTGVLSDYLTQDNALATLKASFFLQARHADASCTKFLLKQMDIDNCLEIWTAANFCSNTELLSKATAKVGRHLSEVSQTGAFMELDCETLVSLLSDDGLQVPNEMVVYDAAIGWIKYDRPNREGQLNAVLRAVRFPYLSKQFLTEVVAHEDLVLTNSDAMHTFSRALQYKLAQKDSPGVKRRDNFTHSIVGGCEKFAREQGELAKREAGIKPAFSHWMDIHVMFPFQYFQKNIWFKFIANPVTHWYLFCKEDIVNKHIATPLSKTPCMRPQEDNEQEPSIPGVRKENVFEKYIARPIAESPCMRPQQDNEQEPSIPGVRKENVFEKYIVRPIAESPCIPDSDDEYFEEKTNDERHGVFKENLPIEQVNPNSDILQDSLWTKISKVESSEPAMTNQ